MNSQTLDCSPGSAEEQAKRAVKIDTSDGFLDHVLHGGNSP